VTASAGARGGSAGSSSYSGSGGGVWISRGPSVASAASGPSAVRGPRLPNSEGYPVWGPRPIIPIVGTAVLAAEQARLLADAASVLEQQLEMERQMRALRNRVSDAATAAAGGGTLSSSTSGAPGSKRSSARESSGDGREGFAAAGPGAHDDESRGRPAKMAKRGGGQEDEGGRASPHVGRTLPPAAPSSSASAASGVARSATAAAAAAKTRTTSTKGVHSSSSTAPAPRVPAALSATSLTPALGLPDAAVTLDIAVALALGSNDPNEQLGLGPPGSSPASAAAHHHNHHPADVVRRRYHLLARLLHPDKLRGQRAEGAQDMLAMAEEAFKRIVAAYKRLVE
jgi:hypothetical protein